MRCSIVAFRATALLSHDLIEGAYARAGLVTDIEVIDDYPSHHSAHTRRKHRWVRGDWQITQWLSSQVPDESGRMVDEPDQHHLAMEDLRQSTPQPGRAGNFPAAGVRVVLSARRSPLLDHW